LALGAFSPLALADDAAAAKPDAAILADSYHLSSAGGQTILKAMTDDASVSAGMKAAVLAVHN